MKKKAKHVVPSVVKLAQEIGLSRQYVWELIRLPDAPRVTKQGYDVDKWKAYIGHRASRIQTQAGQRANLQIDLLNVKLLREKHDLQIASGEIRRKIWKEIYNESMRCLHLLVGKLNQIPNELPPRLEGCDAHEIREKLQTALCKARNTFADELDASRKREGMAEETDNVVLFDERKAATG
jgi:hypothetical protein